MMGIHAPTAREERITAALRERAIKEILDRNDLVSVAKALDLMPTGVESLLHRSKWTLETAFRVVDALGIDVVEGMERATDENGARVS